MFDASSVVISRFNPCSNFSSVSFTPLSVPSFTILTFNSLKFINGKIAVLVFVGGRFCAVIRVVFLRHSSNHVTTGLQPFMLDLYWWRGRQIICSLVTEVVNTIDFYQYTMQCTITIHVFHHRLFFNLLISPRATTIQQVVGPKSKTLKASLGVGNGPGVPFSTV